MAMQIQGQISTYGTKASIERFTSKAPIQSGTTTQVGFGRKAPEKDSWCYASPWYSFHSDNLDEEVRDFLIAHAQVGDVLASVDPERRFSFFTLSPIGDGDEETFACILSHDTLKALSTIGVDLQIAPATVMPEAPYWHRAGNELPP